MRNEGVGIVDVFAATCVLPVDVRLAKVGEHGSGELNVALAPSSQSRQGGIS